MDTIAPLDARSDIAVTDVSLPLPRLVEARFVGRPNRFLVRAELNDESVVTAHLADPGRLVELLLPRCRLWLRPTSDPRRKTRFSAVLVERPDARGYVSLDTTLANRLVHRALEQEDLGELAAWLLLRREPSWKDSRFDFLLAHRRRRRHLLLEVKSVTLVNAGYGLFPDAVTARGTRHLETLAEAARSGCYDAALLFVAQRSDVESVGPAHHIDPRFSDSLAAAEEAGVRLLARRCRVSTRAISLGKPIPVSSNPRSR